MAKVDGKAEILKAVSGSGLQRDPRAKHAYKLPNVEDWRLDLGGARSARLERRVVGTWTGYSEPLYYGKVRSPEFAKRWVDWAVESMRARRLAGAEPKQMPTEKETRTRAAREEKQRTEHELKHGPGYYVTNSGLSGVGFRIANHGPYKTLEEAADKAWETLQGYLQQKLQYLLPVEVVQGKTRRSVEMGEGYTWWVNGKRKGEPADPRQMRMFGDSAPGDEGDPQGADAGAAPRAVPQPRAGGALRSDDGSLLRRERGGLPHAGRQVGRLDADVRAAREGSPLVPARTSGSGARHHREPVSDARTARRRDAQGLPHPRAERPGTHRHREGARSPLSVRCAVGREDVTRRSFRPWLEAGGRRSLSAPGACRRPAGRV